MDYIVKKERIDQIRSSKEDRVIFKIRFPNRTECSGLYFDFTDEFIDKKISNDVNEIDKFKKNTIYPIAKAYSNTFDVDLEYMSDFFSTNKHLKLER